jgi:hypothetical protein
MKKIIYFDPIFYDFINYLKIKESICINQCIGNEIYYSLHIRLEDDMLDHLLHQAHYSGLLRKWKIPDYQYLILDNYLSFLFNHIYFYNDKNNVSVNELNILNSNKDSILISNSTSNSKILLNSKYIIHVSSGLAKKEHNKLEHNKLDFVISLLKSKYTNIKMYNYSYIKEFTNENILKYGANNILTEFGREIKAIPDFLISVGADKFIGRGHLLYIIL